MTIEPYFWYYRVPGRAPEHWDKIIEISILMPTDRQNEQGRRVDDNC